jgi:CBS domain containing-hemolysin-like protein
MSPLLLFLAVVGLVLLSGVFSGAETGVYSVSRVRLEGEAEEGRRSARMLARLLRDDSTLLIALLLGNNLTLELLTYLAEVSLSGLVLPANAQELLAAAALTPIVFLFGELVPKDLFRRRPHLLLGIVAPFVSAFRWLVSPLAWPLALLAGGLERLIGLRQEEFARILRREEMVEILAEGRRTGALAPGAEELAHNVLVLRHTPLVKVAIPWARADVVDVERGEAEACATVAASSHTRLPVLGIGAERRRMVLGYVHQLDVLGAPPGSPLQSSLRPLLELAPDLPLDRAVARLQAAGQRLALVGTARSPKGLVSLMDLLASLASQPRFPQPSPVARIDAGS